MRKLFAVLFALVLAVGLSSSLVAQDFKLETKQVKNRQKEEKKALKLKHKFAKQALGGRDLPKSVRAQMKHQQQREERELREKQKDERLDLKDRRRVLQEMQSRQ
jgi:Na+-transporting methylmalonyl-CoA/oxaloacetate decarboxylase gamma subunit